jgi:hypothetical protein
MYEYGAPKSSVLTSGSTVPNPKSGPDIFFNFTYPYGVLASSGLKITALDTPHFFKYLKIT